MEKETHAMKTEKLKTSLGGKERNSPWPKAGVSNSTVRQENSDPKEIGCF